MKKKAAKICQKPLIRDGGMLLGQHTLAVVFDTQNST